MVSCGGRKISVTVQLPERIVTHRRGERSSTAMVIARGLTHLVLRIVLCEKDVDDRELVHVSVTLKLLPHPCSDDGDGEGNRVHGLDLGGLLKVRRSATTLIPHPLSSGYTSSPPQCMFFSSLGDNGTYSSNPFSVSSEHPALRIVPIGRCSPQLAVSVGPKLGIRTLSGRLGELGRCDRHGEGLWALN
jgi:hypothetical protein